MASFTGLFLFIILAARAVALHPREASALCDLTACGSPGAGPVCAYDANGLARTFRDRCHLETVSCHEGTHYAVVGKGEC